MKKVKVEALINIGPKSTRHLNDIGIYTKADLVEVGAVPAFVKMSNECRSFRPSLNLLYGLVAVIEGVHWRDVAKSEKAQLLMELEGHKALERLFK